MSYVENNLVPGERVVYRAHLHWKIYTTSILFVALGVISVTLAGLTRKTGVESSNTPRVLLWVAAAFGLAAIVTFLGAFMKARASEFAVTDKRVIIKTGLFNRRTMETLLNKVENISVDQGMMGRVLNFGTIRVTGTGGTTEPFADISHPLEFRKQVQAETISWEERREVGGAPVAAPPTLPRDERECPYCAERVLAKAKVCRFCGKELTPA